jgi:CelD/BcsL family acetyltransferase involved in cellulose biosynthesis
MAGPPSSGFYRQMLRRLAASGAARVVFARAGERDVGYVFGGVAGPFYRGQQFSYAEECRSLSLGNLLQLAQIRWLCEDGVARYDMGSVMEYKTHWAELEGRGEAWLLRSFRRLGS